MVGHNIECTGYIFNDGEVVHIADFRSLNESSLKLITRQPELMIMPLTSPKGTRYHAGIEDLINYTKRINPKRVLINHMAVECDYEQVRKQCLENMCPAYDGEVVEW